jgi:hypothetical protein
MHWLVFHSHYTEIFAHRSKGHAYLLVYIMGVEKINIYRHPLSRTGGKRNRNTYMYTYTYYTCDTFDESSISYQFMHYPGMCLERTADEETHRQLKNKP